MLLQPSAYATDYVRRPDEPVSIGLRLLSEADLQAARAGATKCAVDLFPGDGESDAAVLAYNDALLREVVARAACDPNDARQPYFQGDEEEVREALTSDGCRAVWDELERLAIERSPLAPLADDAEIASLPAAWVRCAGMLSVTKQRQLRRLAGFVLRALYDAETEGETVEDEG